MGLSAGSRSFIKPHQDTHYDVEEERSGEEDGVFAPMFPELDGGHELFEGSCRQADQLTVQHQHVATTLFLEYASSLYYFVFNVFSRRGNTRMVGRKRFVGTSQSITFKEHLYAIC